jgi:hypothetical protein
MKGKIMPYENRTIHDSGVRLDGNLLDIATPAGTGVTPAQAAALAAPLLDFLNMIPYSLDEHGRIAYRTNTLALTHQPILVYAPNHPLAGQPILAQYNDGDYITRHGGAPMPFIDFDTIPPYALEKLLGALYEIRNAILNAV